MSDMDGSSPDAFLGGVLQNYHYFRTSEESTGTLPVTFSLTGSSLIVVTGENATGKSFFRRFLSAALRKCEPAISPVHLSQQGRCEGGFVSAAIYGGETDESTGANSAHVITTAFRHAVARDSKHAFIFDEPDIGLSDNYAAGAGLEIREFTEAKPDLTFFTLVMSHNRALIGELLPANPSHIHFGSYEPLSLQQWMERKPVPTRLAGLRELSGETHSRLGLAISDRKKLAEDFSAK